MPELPEVETIMRGLTHHLKDRRVETVMIRQTQLRWPIPVDLSTQLSQQKILKLSRRGKYLLIHFKTGTLIIHLGMSGSLRVLSHEAPPTKHDHVDFILSHHQLLRYHDPRRFGAILWTNEDPLIHPLIQSIGIEPLDPNFNDLYLYSQTVKRKLPIKSLIMNSKIVAGIGNIYAAEALFLAKINPTMPSCQLTLEQCNTLVNSIREIICLAIAAGGTTLKDFVDSSGKPGYFSQKLYVYGRANLPCRVCATPLQSIRMGQRSTVFCKYCQPVSLSS